jgi:excisionase family DNA binding protein
MNLGTVSSEAYTSSLLANNLNDILTVDQLSDMLKATSAQVYELTRKRYRNRHGHSLPNFRIGREMRFRRRDVEKWIEQSIQSIQ